MPAFYTHVSFLQADALWSLSRLWAVRIMVHSPPILFILRKRNYQNPLGYLIWPNTGSTVCFRSRYRLGRPARLILSAINPDGGLTGVETHSGKARELIKKPSRVSLPLYCNGKLAVYSRINCDGIKLFSKACLAGEYSGLLGTDQTLDVSERLHETFGKAGHKHPGGDDATEEKTNATEPSPTRITPSQRHVVDSGFTQFLGPALKRKLLDPRWALPCVNCARNHQ